MSSDTLYEQILAEFRRHAKMLVPQAKLSHYHKQEVRAFGINAPTLHGIHRGFKREVKALECADALALAERLFRDGIEETIHAGVLVLRTKIDCITNGNPPRKQGTPGNPTRKRGTKAKPQGISTSNLAYIDRLGKNLNSWSTADDFALMVLQPLLERHTSEVLALLKKWNRSRNMWQRRASVVAFTRKAGESGRYTDAALALCENLLSDKEDLVQKGVGWCLKDVMRGDKKRVLEYVKRIRAEGVPSVITLYAVRDLKGEERRLIRYDRIRSKGPR